jgi:sugar phosphate isomerase/epimerase
MDFALNQKTAPKLGFAAFLDLAAELGCVGVEPRNDLGRPLFDGIEPARAGEMARERGLRFIGLSEIYPFNDWNENRRAAVAEMRSLASEMVKTGASADSEMGSRLASLGSKLSEAKESVASFKDEGRTPSKVVVALPLAPSPEPRRSWWRRLAG